MRILLLNPNTTDAITQAMATRARSLAGPEVEVRAATGRFGARYISSRTAAAIAGHAALDAYAAHGAECDAVYLACFGDPALLALKELAPVPVVGMAEAACHLACTLGRRFGIVTGGERWGPMLGEFVDLLGLGPRLAGVRTVAPSGGLIARDPEGALALLAAAIDTAAREDGAEVVVLGGAALAGLAERLAPGAPVPVICSFEAGLRATLAVAALKAPPARTGSFAPPEATESIGLAPELAARLAGGR